MLHFVGFAEDESGALYVDGVTDEVHLLPEHVGQIVDWTPRIESEQISSPTRVGAVASLPQSGSPQASALQAARAPSGRAFSGARRGSGTYGEPESLLERLGAARRIAPPATLDESPAFATPAPAAEPWWAHYGEKEGGYYATTPTPGAEFEEEAFGTTQEQFAASGDFVGATVWPWEVQGEAQRQVDEQSQKRAAHHRQRGGGGGGGRSGGGGGGGQPGRRVRTGHEIPQAPMQLSPEAQAQADADAQAQADADAQDAADARAQAQADADYDKQMQQMELQQMRQQTQMQQMQVQQAQQEQQGGYADEQDYGDDEDQYADQYAVQGPAPEGLGALIGGIAGGIGGMFFGSPEIGAPLGAALGGAIQGGVEKATGGHPTGASMGGGAIQGGIGQATGGHPTGASMGRGASKTYLQGSQRVTVSGAFSPDGLFEPGPGEISALANLIAMSNSLLRKYRPGTSWTGDRRGSSAQITISAASGAFDLPRYANLGVEWIEEHFEKGADAMYDFVGGGPVARDFGPYSAATIKTILDDLHGAGLTVSGDNPYSVDANQHGIVLGATYHDSGLLTVSIVSSNFYVSHNQVWDKISPMMPAADW